VRIVLVNYNGGAWLHACLQSIEEARSPSFDLEEVTLVDNGSTDGSERIEVRGLPLRVVKNDDNRGFGAAANQGARGATSDHLLFLNPDARILHGALREAMSYLDAHEDTGVVGVQLVDEHGRIHRSCAREPRPAHFAAKILGLDALLGPGHTHMMDDWDHASTRDVFHVMGCFYLIRRSLFEELGGFDERFFVYLEDLDLSARVHATGARSVFLASTRIFHKGGGLSDRVKAARLAYFLHSRIVYGVKHFSPTTAGALAVATFAVEPFTRLAHALGVKRSVEQALDTVRGYRLLAARTLRGRW
jgi:hypothetical protein